MNEEEFTELTPEYESDEPCEDSTEVLLEKYDRRRTQKIDDVFAMQAVMCVILAAAMFAANLLCPEICEPLYERLRELTSDGNEIMPNLIDVIMSL